MMTKEEATEAGEKLLKKMKGRGWKLRVHQNLGWHYAVYNEQGEAVLTIHESNGSCWALLGDRIGGYLHFSDNFQSKNPNKVVEHYIKKAVNYRNEQIEYAAGVEKMNK